MKVFKENHVSPRNRFIRTGHVFRLGLIGGALGAFYFTSSLRTGSVHYHSRWWSWLQLPPTNTCFLLRMAIGIPMDVLFVAAHSLHRRLSRFRDLSPSTLRLSPFPEKKRIIIVPTRKIHMRGSSRFFKCIFMPRKMPAILTYGCNMATWNIDDSVKHVHNYSFASICGIRLWMSCKCIVVPS